MKKYLERIYQKSFNDYCHLLKNNLKNNHLSFVVTVNPETLMSDDNLIKKLLLDKRSSLVADGIAVVRACKKLKINVKQRITGIDLAEFLLEEANKQKKSLYLFGAKEDVLNKLVKIINAKYQNINLVGYSHGFAENKDQVMKEIIKLQPDICLVALGIPLQEKLIYENLKYAKKGIFMGVGGSFDVLSGHKKRAPKLMRKLNLEWLYRIVKEPKRFKKFYKNNIKFLKKIKKMK